MTAVENEESTSERKAESKLQLFYFGFSFAVKMINNTIFVLLFSTLNLIYCLERKRRSKTKPKLAFMPVKTSAGSNPFSWFFMSHFATISGDYYYASQCQDAWSPSKRAHRFVHSFIFIIDLSFCDFQSNLKQTKWTTRSLEAVLARKVTRVRVLWSQSQHCVEMQDPPKMKASKCRLSMKALKPRWQRQVREFYFA